MPDPYPPSPQHWPSVQTPNFIWPDGSMFQFDLPPRYVLDDWTDLREGSIYDIPLTPKPQRSGDYMGWTNWVDKTQKDYRFANVSDYNAQANIFSEVRDPWMFTEYLYEGRKKVSDKDDASPQLAGIVEPPLLNPIGIDRVVDTSGGRIRITQSTANAFNDQPPTVVPVEHQTLYDLEPKWRSEAGSNKEYWECELAACSWNELLADGSINRDFTRLNISRRVVRNSVPKLNSGVRLFRHPVWVNSTRWGQSQNIPERTVNVTGPKDFFRPQGRFTGRIVPKVTIKWGIPLYDNCDVRGPQKVIRYDDYGDTSSGNIILWHADLTGPDGQPDGIFTYASAPAPPDASGDKVIMPRNNRGAILNWTPPDFATDDLIHRGCQFWVGRLGETKCQYYEQFKNNLPTLASIEIPIVNSGTPIPQISTPAFSDLQHEPRLFVKSSTVTMYQDVTPTGAPLAFELIKTDGQVTSVRVVININPSVPATPNDLLAGLGTGIVVKLVVLPKNTPYPHHLLCGTNGASGRDASIAAYRSAGGKCPYYSPVGRRVVGSYSVQASNGAEWANMQRGLPAGYKKGWADTAAGEAMMGIGFAGGGLAGGVTAGLGLRLASQVQTPDPFTSGLAKEDFQRIEVTFEPEVVSLSGKERFYDTVDGKPHGKDPESDIRIRAGTGFYPIDWETDTPYGGVDSVFFAEVNQINYRVMRNVMHCYHAEHCDTIINTPGANAGWARGRFSNINFTAHALRIPGYPGINGTDKYCHIGNSRCPYNQLDRRANEYNENFKVLLREILVPFRGSGLAGFIGKGLREGFISPDGQFYFLAPGEQADPANWSNAICVAVGPETGQPPLLGHWQPVVKDALNISWRIYFYYDTPSFAEGYTLGRVFAHIIQFTDDNQPCYISTADTALQAKMSTLYDAASLQIPWIVELEDNHQDPIGNATFVTNSKPFAGGRNPEYKDHSKRYRQIMTTRGGYSDRSFAEGATDSNQFGGPSWNRAPVAGRTKTGYWIESDGEWILDGRKIGADEDYVEPRPRMRNIPSVAGNRYPVDGTPGVTVQDDASPQFNRDGDWAIIGTTYSNDTKAYLAWLRSVWDSFLPSDPNSDDPDAKIHIIPPSPNEDMLPRERFWYRCDKCGVDFPEEEVNYLKSLQYADNTPFYPIPVGREGDGGECGCPRNDGGILMDQGSYDRFMTCYSRGEVDVWAPPGTTVYHDGFFWKNPTMINRLHNDQSLWKLGVYNPNARGGGYSLANLEPGVDKLGRLQSTTAKGYQPGIAHQVVYPIATSGSTVIQVRTLVAGIYHLTDEDYAVIHRAGIGNPVKLTSIQELTTVLNPGDVVRFWHQNGNDKYIAGLPVAAMVGLPPALLSESLVQSDISQNPIPQRTDFADDGMGDRLFNDAIRRWLLDAVFGSLQNWSSSIYIQANAMARSLISRGINPQYAHSINPNTGQVLEVDEQVIASYSVADGGGLKMVTMQQVKRLRNRLLPMLAYDLTYPTYTAGGDFTDRAQKSHLDRFSETRRSLPMPKFGSIQPQVLAATSTGKDYYTEWETGDIEGTKRRAYYPVGTTWWRINQTVGQIKRNGGQNRLHLDDATKTVDGDFVYPEYTGDTITSTCTFFLHGLIPMDKEVVRALVVYAPDDAPSMDAIGCQGQYTGYVGTPNFFDPSAIDLLEYRGNAYCFWQHYHGYTTNHEGDIGSFAGDSNAVFGGFSGAKSKKHAEKHDPKDGLTLDDPSLPTPFTDDYPDTSTNPQFALDMDNFKPWMAGGPGRLYTPYVDIMGQNYVEDTYGFDPSSVGSHAPYQNFIARARTTGYVWGQPIKFIANEHETWKDMSFSKYDTIIQRYSVRARAAVNTNESVQSLTYIGSTFRSLYHGREQQPIPGWIDFEGYDTSGRFDRNIKIDPQVLDTPPFIVLTDSSVSVSEPGGGNGQRQAGSVGKVLNITDIVTKLYNDRVNRYYKCLLGAAFADLFNLVKSKTDTNLGQNPQFHSGTYDPEYFWNYRYMKSGHGMWLTDPWHHPPTVNGYPAVGNEDGDPIGQTQDDRDGRVEEVTDWDGSEKVETDPDRMTNHPNALFGATPEPFTEGAPSSVKPTPADRVGRIWQVTDDTAAVHSFTVSLLQTPYELERRPWRYEAPTVDATNATCPNPSCLVNNMGWTVGQFYEHSQGSWGYGVIPSTHSEYCAMCRTKLVGVVFSDGDGITTVSYGKPMERDAIVSAIEAKADTTDVDAKHGFVVEYWNTTVGQWRTLINVNWDPILEHYSWQQWDGAAWVTATGNSLPTIWKGCEGVGSVPRSGTVAGAHFVVTSAAKVRYRIPRPAAVAVQDPVAPGTCIPNVPNRTVRVSGLTQSASRYVGRTVYLIDSIGNETPATITDATIAGGSVDLKVAVDVTLSHTHFQVRWTTYLNRCTQFRVYGYPFAAGEVVITPPGYVQPLLTSAGVTSYTLNVWPTQISRVTLLAGESVEVTSTESQSVDPDDFYWTVKADRYNGVDFYTVTGGMWHYDYQTNQIVVPSVYLDPVDNQKKNVWLLNQDKYEQTTNPLEVKTIPVGMNIEYFAGLGVPVDVGVEAFGLGPSYQLERDSICFVAGENDNHEQPTDPISAPDAMPSMGQSVPLTNRGGQRFDLKWHVYNHEPIVWDNENNKSVAWLTGDELGAGEWGDSNVMDLFTGRRGDYVSNLGPNATIGGKVKGTVTLYGSPSTILSGNCWVYAKATTARSYNLPDGTKVVTNERTGGYRSGAFVFRLEVTDNPTNRRTGITSKVPKVLIYLRERDLSETL